VIAAAGAAVLAAGPAVSMTHGHRWLGFVFIGMHVVLLVMALVLLSRMKNAGSDSR
jgi:uncharacterized membrane protein